MSPRHFRDEPQALHFFPIQTDKEKKITRTQKVTATVCDKHNAN